MDHRRCICQLYNLLILICFSLSSCGSKEEKIKNAEYKAPDYIMAKPVWFDGPERFHYKQKNGKLADHPFFDLMPFWLPKSSSLSFFLVNKANDDFYYKFDLKTGKTYKDKKLCKENDIWKRYKKKIWKAPYSTGIVPRLLDQSGQAQEIWLFGDTKYFKQDKLDHRYTERANILGGVVLQYCESFPCRKNLNWVSRLILIGKHPLDPKLKDVKNLSELKTKVDWNYVRAFAENVGGHKLNGSKYLPAYRITGEVGPLKAAHYAFKNGFMFNINHMNTLRKQCYKLYDYVWDNFEKIRNYKVKQSISTDTEKTKNVIKISSKLELGNNVFKDKLSAVKNIDNLLLNQSKENNFKGKYNEFFAHFYYQYGEIAKTCFQFVQASNINEDRKRHWAFAYLESFFHLFDLKQVYQCGSNSWLDNPKSFKKKKIYEFKPEYCSTRSLNRSMDHSIIRMNVLKKRSLFHYRYIEYDNGIGGSHEKIYSWIPDNGKVHKCNKEVEQGLIFPADISWHEFDIDKNNKKSKSFIYE